MKRPFRSFSLLFVLLTIGCGPAGQHFHGTYSVAGTTTLTLTGYRSQTEQFTGIRRISEGTAADLILSDPSGQCLLPANVEGDVATVTTGASCTESANGVTVTMTVTNGTASISGNVVQLRLTGNLTATYEGRTYPGSFSENSTLTRVAK